MQLEELQALVGPTRSIEEISAAIERVTKSMDEKLAKIDARIESLRARSDALQSQQINISKKAQEQARAYYEFIQQQALKLLDERLKQLAEIGIDTSSALTSTEQLQSTTNEILTQIRDILAGAENFASGGFIPKSVQGGLAFLHGPEYVVPQDQLSSLLRGNNISKLQGNVGHSGQSMTIQNLNVMIRGNVDSPERVKEVTEKFRKAIRREFGYMWRDPKFRRDNNIDV
jgi:hypothetical protein